LRGAQYGVRTGAVAVDMESVRERKRRIVGAFRGGSQQRLEETAGLDLIFGRAAFHWPDPGRGRPARRDGDGARTVELDEARGFLKAVVDTTTGQILGCAVLGIEGGELMSILQMAIAAEVPYTRVRDMIFAHPTLAEGLNTLFDED
jgi:pyruvate/2-oxoglutarate dehydrogenase complex dihydrolipoamide dehydrogenase (E3) component